MKSKLLAVTLCMSQLANQVALAFDTRTHGAMSAESITRSILSGDLNSSAKAKSLGLVDYPSGVVGRYPTFGKRYVDIGPEVNRRTANEFQMEGRIIDELRNPSTQLTIPETFSIPSWIVRGSIQEDDNTSETPNADEPGGVFDRVFGHFFDPQRNRGLQAFGLSDQPRSVDWALQPNAEVISMALAPKKNHYKISHARESMWRALTLKTLEANGSLTDNVWPSNWAAATKEELRKAYWATTFRALGDVVHLLQDSAQPQHTRNDAHAGRGCVAGLGCAGGHDSFFEKYLRQRTLRSEEFQLEEGFMTPVPVGTVRTIKKAQLIYGGYPKPTFSTYADFFSTGTGGANATGKGLANYSNRGFYSFGTNIWSASALLNYPSPSPTGSGLGTSFVDESSTPPIQDMSGKALTGRITFKTGAVQDTATGIPEPNVKLAAVGAWDQFLQQKNSTWSSYTLNYYNYDDQARLLVPRAVAYSAGLIDYFFRGQMYVAPPTEGVYAVVDHGSPTSNCKDTCGFTKVNLKIANATPDITPPGGTATAQSIGQGTIVAVAKFRRNSCYTPSLSGEFPNGSNQTSFDYYNGCVFNQSEEIVVSDPQSVQGLPACDRTVLGDCASKAVAKSFNFASPIPINAASITLQVVFRGSLGAEADAVVVETVDVSEPTYFTYMNATDYIKIETSLYTRSQVVGDPSLLSKVEQATPNCIVSGQLKESCLQPFSISFPLKWGNPGTTIVNAPIDLAQPGTFSRFAMLLDPDQFAAIDHSDTPCEPKSPVNVLWRLTRERLINVPGQQALELMATESLSVRGVRSDGMVVCHNQGDGLNQTLPTPVLATMPPLVGNNVNPIPVQGFSVGP